MTRPLQVKVTALLLSVAPLRVLAGGFLNTCGCPTVNLPYIDVACGNGNGGTVQNHFNIDNCVGNDNGQLVFGHSFWETCESCQALDQNGYPFACKSQRDVIDALPEAGTGKSEAPIKRSGGGITDVVLECDCRDTGGVYSPLSHVFLNSVISNWNGNLGC